MSAPTGDRTFANKHKLLQWACQTYEQPESIAIEFGVYQGETLTTIRNNFTGNVYGFDSFQGLPEDWREGYEKESFKPETIPDVQGTELVIGLFNQTLTPFLNNNTSPISVIHFDADLYSSTIYPLTHITTRLTNPAILIFDEWHNYPGCEQHEQRAFHEWAAANPNITWRIVATVKPDHDQQVAIETKLLT